MADYIVDTRLAIGVDDFVLLENYNEEEAFIDNLRIRYKSDIIYTYIGPVLITINPYKELNIHSETIMKQYKNTHVFELRPHMFV